MDYRTYIFSINRSAIAEKSDLIMHPGSVQTNRSFRAKIVPLHLYHWHIVPLKLILLYQYII